MIGQPHLKQHPFGVQEIEKVLSVGGVGGLRRGQGFPGLRDDDCLVESCAFVERFVRSGRSIQKEFVGSQPALALSIQMKRECVFFFLLQDGKLELDMRTQKFIERHTILKSGQIKFIT